MTTHTPETEQKEKNQHQISNAHALSLSLAHIRNFIRLSQSFLLTTAAATKQNKLNQAMTTRHHYLNYREKPLLLISLF